MDHHFVPKYYLRGFYGAAKKLYQYNKDTRKVDKAGKSASQMCYEIDLHALHLDDSKDYLIETCLGMLETQCKLFLQAIESESDDLDSIRAVPEACNILNLMLYMQFWRLPSSIEFAEQASERLLSLYACRSGSTLLSMFDDLMITEMFENRSDPNVLKIIQFLLLPLLSCDFDGTLPDGVTLTRFVGDEPDLLCSDTPVCYEAISNDFVFQGEVIFPLTKRIVLAKILSPGRPDIDAIQDKIISGAALRYFGSSLELIERYKI